MTAETKPIIRPATLDDAPFIAELSAQLGYPGSMGQSATRLETLTQARDHVVMVACLEDGSVVGWIHVFLALRVESHVFAELGGFVVDEQHRGRGFGRFLLAAAEEWVLERDVSRLRVRPRSQRAAAHSFYRRRGFTLTKEQHVFDKELGSGE